jgi:sugar phosphate isomerase/epimerase
MRLGGPIPLDGLAPDDWIAALRAKGYRAAYCPVDEKADEATVTAFARAAAEAGIVIAEVGAWSNPISPDEATRQAAITYNQQRLDLADRIGARCCVNVAGARGPRWAGPHPDNLSEATFDLIVETVRQIIDAVRPTRTYYALEAMPWVYPDTPASYERLLAAVGRERLAVHLDPVNWISSPQRYFDNAALLRESFQRLGPHIRSCHAKDIALDHELTVHLSEVRPGLGGLDYVTFLGELSRLDADTPLMLEHLPSQAEYDQAAAHIRGVAQALGLSL